jgi:Spy/CpxP family protein refolding chaperone
MKECHFMTKGEKMVVQKRFWVCLSLLLVIAFTMSVVWAASEDSNSTSQKGSTTTGQQMEARRGGMFERGDFQERMKTMLKQELGALDEEWKIIEPRLTRVMTLSQEANTRPTGGMMGMGGPGGMAPPMFPGMGSGRGMRGQRPVQEGDSRPDIQQSDVQKAMDALRQTLEKEKPDTADIKAKLIALRTTREKAREELAKAQQELREILTIDQEAKLVLTGLLD